MAHNDCLPNPIEPTQTDAKSPLDVQLLDDLRTNQEFLCDQVNTAIKGGTSGAAIGLGAVGTIIAGGKDNTPIFRKKRFGVAENVLLQSDTNVEGFNPEGKGPNDRVGYWFDSNDSPQINPTFTSAYQQTGAILTPDEVYAFNLNEVENCFTIDMGGTGTLKVEIDGLPLSNFNIVDQNGNVIPDAIPDVTALPVPLMFFGLKAGNHEIKVTNTDASQDVFVFFYEIGFLTAAPAMESTLTIEDGRATIRGTKTDFTGGSFTFDRLLGGQTSSIVCDKDGVLSKLEGIPQAHTQVKSEESLSFPGVTTLPVKSVTAFPDTGICLFQTDTGLTSIFSYNGTTDTTVQTQSFDNVIWQIEPTQNLTAETNYEGDGLESNQGRAVGMLNINMWAAPSITVDASNENIDFQITQSGVQSTHTASITRGVYSADLVPFGEAVVKAMSAAFVVDGNFFCEYNPTDQLWSIGAISGTVSELNFLWNSGVNASSSVATILGFDEAFDSSGSISYVASIEKQALAAQVYERDASFMEINDPRIKFTPGPSEPPGFELPINHFARSAGQDAFKRLGLDNHFVSTDEFEVICINPDNDCSGMTISFLAQNSFGGMWSILIDGFETNYGVSTYVQNAAYGTRDKILNVFISFPRGSKTVILTRNPFTTPALSGGGLFEEWHFLGCRQYFTKPAWEKLNLEQAIITANDIAPIQLYRTSFVNAGGALYVDGANDNINSISEGGTWGTLAGEHWAGTTRRSNTSGAFVEYNFTLLGDGGGCELMTPFKADGSRSVQVFLSQTGIVEGTDLFTNVSINGYQTDPLDYGQVVIRGLKAGTYNVRFKHNGIVTTQYLYNNAFNIIDTVPTDPLTLVLGGRCWGF